jgi:poly(glycerol-phosphate) alpha-glucosyltransferase
MGIVEGMRCLLEMTDAERAAMGARGCALVEQQFTWPQVAAQMKEVYEWILGGGAKPGGVR